MRFAGWLTMAAMMFPWVTAPAATTTSNFSVTATVQSICYTAAYPLAFPAYTPGAGAAIANSTILVGCSKNTPYTVSISAGSTTGGTFTRRLMASAGNTLQYNLYTSAALATVFGDGTGGSATVNGIGIGTVIGTGQAIAVYGQLFDNASNQAATPGAYSDVITVSVSY